jgi:Mg2+/citrate symporter
MKQIWQSKTVWFNVITTLTAVSLLTAETYPEVATLFVYFSTIGNIILRVFFTNTEIKK